MTKNGGKRPGAGRPKGSLSVKARLRLEMQAGFIDFVNKNRKNIWDAQLKLALGVWIPVRHPITGKVINVAQKPPDGMTLAWMQDQVYGRAPQKVEVEGEMNGTQEHTLSPETEAALERAIKYAIPNSRRTGPSGDAKAGKN